MSCTKEALKYIAALDVGTTTIRCHVFNEKAEKVGEASKLVELVYPQPGFVEINPDTLWEDVKLVMEAAIKGANLKAEDLSCFGVATQRASFITWRRDNGKPFHNFITWKDMRAKKLVQDWNNSLQIKGLKSGAYLLYSLTRNSRFLAGSKLQLSSTQTTLRLLWVMQNIPELAKEVQDNNVMFGTVETWLIYKLTGGTSHVSDYTNASATGMFDPFVLKWSSWIHTLLKIPLAILPQLVPNDYNFGTISRDILGAEIPIKCVVADQQASMFGSCCFKDDILKVTLGTGTFLDLQTKAPHPSCEAIYPLIGHGLGGEVCYIAEGSCNDTGSLIQWALQIDLIKSPSEASKVALEVPDNDGVYFIPAFSGLGAPIFDEKAGSGFLGVKPTTKKAHLMRAILESIVFRAVLQYQVIMKEVNPVLNKIYVDGGVSKNDFVCQMLADMTGLELERPSSTEMGVLGVAFIAGLNSGIWKSKSDLCGLRKVAQVFSPNFRAKQSYLLELERWRKVVDRFRNWCT